MSGCDSLFCFCRRETSSRPTPRSPFCGHMVRVGIDRPMCSEKQETEVRHHVYAHPAEMRRGSANEPLQLVATSHSDGPMMGDRLRTEVCADDVMFNLNLVLPASSRSKALRKAENCIRRLAGQREQGRKGAGTLGDWLCRDCCNR